MNALYFRASWDREFVEAALADVVVTDEFTRNLLDIYRRVMSEGLVQKVALQIQRSDYMSHAPPDRPLSLKQVEVNNIAASFSALASRCSQLHRTLLPSFNLISPTELNHKLPPNNALHTVASGLAEAWRFYGCQSAVILVVVEDRNQNIADQKLVEFAVLELTNWAARCIRLTLGECQKKLRIDEEKADRRLVVRPPEGNESAWREVAVVYFRSGYVPRQYRGKAEWDARLTIERSKAIKCPWIGFHLAGTKKVQQMLAQPGVVERFINDDGSTAETETSRQIRDTFVGLWGLENKSESNLVLAEVYKDPENFVLKPQLEGGGNNIYGQDILTHLQRMTSVERQAYILMERIRPLQNRGYLIRPNSGAELAPPKAVATVSELGVYGYLIGDGNGLKVIRNVADGHLLRTKSVGVDEGGIIAGASVLDSPNLF